MLIMFTRVKGFGSFIDVYPMPCKHSKNNIKSHDEVLPRNS